MSYSFNVRASTKEEAEIMCAESMREIVKNQPCHKIDSDEACILHAKAINLLPDDETKDIVVSANGYVSGICSEGEGELVTLTGVCFGVSASLVDKSK